MLFVLPIIVNPTYGHASALLEGIDANVTASGATVIEASFGLLWSGGPDAPWRWLCHEAVTLEGAVIAPRYAITSNDVIVAVVPALSQTRETSLPVYWSADQCAWTASEGLAGVPVIDVAAHPANPELVIAISADITDQSGGAVYRSRDGGQTFSPLRIDSDR